nr:retrotransposon protein, putative, Ty1-copia subclass [Tanacetum cinerariifolium]
MVCVIKHIPIPPPPKREDPAKDSICHECGEIGHWKRNYPQYLSELLKKKKLSLGATNSGIFTIELNTFLNRSWIYDTGCGTHICNTTQGLRDHGIIPHRTPPYTPQHNGVSERRNRTLLDMVRSMTSQTTLSKSFWDYELKTAARILNIGPTKKVEKTPYEVWHGQAPKLSYLKVWGCEALVKRDTLTKPDKLEPQFDYLPSELLVDLPEIDLLEMGIQYEEVQQFYDGIGIKREELVYEFRYKIVPS